MGELIRRESAGAARAFSGERLTGAVSGQVEIEHYHRYLVAREYCRDKDVLDIAAGEGYGTALLAQVARSAVGIEIDGPTVEAAATAFTRPNLRYLQGDARSIPIPDDSVDIVVSFETLEHLIEQDQFLSELRRVVRPGGLVIMSTPDRDVYSAAGIPPNPYHVLELTRADFEGLLRRSFGHVTIAAQRSLIGSVITGGVGESSMRSYERRGQDIIEGSVTLARAPYLLAFASDGELPALPASVYVYRSDLDTDSQVRFEAETERHRAENATREAIERAERAESAAAAAEGFITRLQALIADLETRLATTIEQRVRSEQLCSEQLARFEERSSARLRRAQHRAELAEAQLADVRDLAERRHVLAEQRGVLINQLETTVSALRTRAEALEAQYGSEASAHFQVIQRLHATEHRLTRIESSNVWRATYHLRWAGARFPGVARQLRQAAKLAWYAGTLQLVRRYKLRRRFAQSLEAPVVPAQVEPPSLPSLAVLTMEPAPAALAARDIAIPSSPEPITSIIISTYGQLAVTLACLKSIADHAPTHPFEVILVDDAYDGADNMTLLGDVAGVQFIRNAENLGFLRSCNAAASLARGRYIHFLNNDTEIQPGAVDALVDLLERRPDAGLAGSKLIFPDGILQEAGGILWTDASGWNYGRGQDPARCEFNYVREVDYCSGASILVRAELFRSLGGFDEAFVPAYYEDADLAFRIRARGLKVLFEPRSVVVHHEGTSHGTDVGAGVKAHQLVNQTRMLEHWGAVLAAEHYAGPGDLLRARDRARGRRVVLVIDHYVPEPDRDAGSRSTLGIVTSLVDAGWIVKFLPHNQLYSHTYTPPLECLGVEVIDQRNRSGLAEWLRDNGMSLDHVLVVRPDIALDVLQHVMRNTRAVLSFYGVDLHFARIRRQSEVDGDAALLQHADNMQRLERRVWRMFDVVIYPSEEEAAVVREMSPGTLARGIIPFSFEADVPRTVATKGRTILFVAGFAHPPNVDAALYLVNQIIPALEAQVGPVRVVLAGAGPTQAVLDLAGLDVEVTGHLSDEALGELYQNHRVAVVPLRFGAGVKGKVVESLCRGLPLVTTSTGAQGIEGLAEIVPVRDDVEGLVSALKVLLTDDDAWLRQSHRQTEFAKRRFSREAMRASVVAALEAGEAAAIASRTQSPHDKDRTTPSE